MDRITEDEIRRSLNVEIGTLSCTEEVRRLCLSVTCIDRHTDKCKTVEYKLRIAFARSVNSRRTDWKKDMKKKKKREALKVLESRRERGDGKARSHNKRKIVR